MDRGAVSRLEDRGPVQFSSREDRGEIPVQEDITCGNVIGLMVVAKRNQLVKR